ncbi:type II toxin-antitoxin system RelE/ParE family toxin [Rhodopirellula baltica]
MPSVREFEDENGLSPFGEWFVAQDGQAADRIREAVLRMELGNFGDVKPVGEGVSERRITFGPGYRIYFGRDGDELIILLAGGTKKRQQRDIEEAKTNWANYKARKRAETRAKQTTNKPSGRKSKGKEK